MYSKVILFYTDMYLFLFVSLLKTFYFIVVIAQSLSRV